tara:strand:- start:12672 stop:13394 length:723 start_codon:yes stop_codon:yes gene_type:complete
MLKNNPEREFPMDALDDRIKERLEWLQREVAFLKAEIGVLTKELRMSHRDFYDQKSEKLKRADELIVANKELAFQNEEKHKRAEELVIANQELAFQNGEKQKRADELTLANSELAFQNSEKHQRAEELVLANRELAFQNGERDKRAEELALAYSELQKNEVLLTEHVVDLKEMMFIISHKVRQPISQILGISYLMDQNVAYSPQELQKIVGYIKKSAMDLDQFTNELTQFMTKVGEKGKE